MRVFRGQVFPGRILGGLIALSVGLAAGLLLQAGSAHAEGKEIACAETNLKFDAPDFEVKCEDYSDSSVDVGELAIGVKIYTLHAISQKDITFLDVIDDRILGSTRVFYSKTSMQNDIDRYFKGNFTGWTAEEDIGDFDVMRFSATFGTDKEPVECFAFRRLGARRFEGIGGKTVGIACSAENRAHAMDAVKRFIGN